MKYYCLIEVPGLPKTANARMHWRVKHKHNKDWEKAVFFAVFGGPGLPVEPLKAAQVSLTRISSVEPDFDNLVISFKPLLDALVQVGVLKNDNSKTIGYPEYGWEKCKQKEGRIRIEVTEK